MTWSLGETVWQVLHEKTQNDYLTQQFDSSGWIPQNCTSVPTKLCPWMFTAELFTTIQREKWIKFASIDEWINKCGLSLQWNITQPWKKNKVGPHTQSFLIMLSEKNQHKRSTLYHFINKKHPEEESHRNREHITDFQELGGGGWRITPTGVGFPFQVTKCSGTGQ